MSENQFERELKWYKQRAKVLAALASDETDLGVAAQRVLDAYRFWVSEPTHIREGRFIEAAIYFREVVSHAH